jgi:hypothetical protein
MGCLTPSRNKKPRPTAIVHCAFVHNNGTLTGQLRKDLLAEIAATGGYFSGHGAPIGLLDFMSITQRSWSTNRALRFHEYSVAVMEHQ